MFSVYQIECDGKSGNKIVYTLKLLDAKDKSPMKNENNNTNKTLSSYSWEFVCAFFLKPLKIYTIKCTLNQLCAWNLFVLIPNGSPLQWQCI